MTVSCALGRTPGPADTIPFASGPEFFREHPALVELEHVAKRRMIEVTGVGAARRIVSALYADGHLPQTARDEIGLLRRQAKRKPAETPSINERANKSLATIEEKTGVAPEVTLQLLAEGCFQGMTHPTTGAPFVVWNSFDAWWRVHANSSRARAMSRNLAAQQSAEQIKQAAETKTREEILSEARAEEDARCRAARTRFA